MTFCKCQTVVDGNFYNEVFEMNKSVGVIKDIDNLGRIVIPKEFRDRLGLDKGVEVVLTKEGVLIRNSKYELVMKEDKFSVK